MKLPFYTLFLIGLVDCNYVASMLWQFDGSQGSTSTVQKRHVDPTAFSFASFSHVSSQCNWGPSLSAFLCSPSLPRFCNAARPRPCSLASHLVAKMNENRRKRGKSKTSSPSPHIHAPSSHGGSKNGTIMIDRSAALQDHHARSLKDRSHMVSLRDQNLHEAELERKGEAAGMQQDKSIADHPKGRNEKGAEQRDL
ncbi:hypothetical protein GUITHDRAFT_151801, partial [Guillardia theta CCMP2712]